MDEGYIGEIRLFGGNFAPRNWAFCQGQLLPIAQNSALFSILGTQYGGDGRTTFALPDLRGRVAVGTGSGPGLTPRQQGQQGGAEQVTLNANQIPAHTHSATATAHGSNTVGDQSSPQNNYPAALSTDRGIPRPYGAAQDTQLGSAAVQVQVQNVGGSQGHDNMQPWLALNYIICLQGIFPSRN